MERPFGEGSFRDRLAGKAFGEGAAERDVWGVSVGMLFRVRSFEMHLLVNPLEAPRGRHSSRARGFLGKSCRVNLSCYRDQDGSCCDEDIGTGIIINGNPHDGSYEAGRIGNYHEIMFQHRVCTLFSFIYPYPAHAYQSTRQNHATTPTSASILIPTPTPTANAAPPRGHR
jgi:hypothetical protein